MLRTQIIMSCFSFFHLLPLFLGNELTHECFLKKFVGKFSQDSKELWLSACVYASEVLADCGRSMCLKGREEHLEGCIEGTRTVW